MSKIAVIIFEFFQNNNYETQYITINKFIILGVICFFPRFYNNKFVIKYSKSDV